MACSVCFDFVKWLFIGASLSCGGYLWQVVARESFYEQKIISAAAFARMKTVPTDGFSAEKVGGISIVFCCGRHSGS